MCKAGKRSSEVVDVEGKKASRTLPSPQTETTADAETGVWMNFRLKGWQCSSARMLDPDSLVTQIKYCPND